MRRVLYQVIHCPLPRESVTELGQKLVGRSGLFSVTTASHLFDASRRATRRALNKLEKRGAVKRRGGHK